MKIWDEEKYGDFEEALHEFRELAKLCKRPDYHDMTPQNKISIIAGEYAILMFMDQWSKEKEIINEFDRIKNREEE